SQAQTHPLAPEVAGMLASLASFQHKPLKHCRSEEHPRRPSRRCTAIAVAARDGVDHRRSTKVQPTAAMAAALKAGSAGGTVFQSQKGDPTSQPTRQSRCAALPHSKSGVSIRSDPETER